MTLPKLNKGVNGLGNAVAGCTAGCRDRPTFPPTFSIKSRPKAGRRAADRRRRIAVAERSAACHPTEPVGPVGPVGSGPTGGMPSPQTAYAVIDRNVPTRGVVMVTVHPVFSTGALATSTAVGFDETPPPPRTTCGDGHAAVAVALPLPDPECVTTW